MLSALRPTRRREIGKSAVLWALYIRAVEQNHPAVVMSLSELIN
jgi:hypothetical protein